jgi:ZIP family zinc transporter
MNLYLTILLSTAVTGVGGLALGALLVSFLRSPSDRSVSLLLRFTAGIMLSVVCFDLIPDALEGGSALPVACWVTIGYLCTYLLNCWIDKRSHHSHSHAAPCQGHVCQDPSHHHRHDNGELCACGHHTLHTAGLVLASAVALHNVPVGMAIGATFADVGQSALSGGVLSAVILGLHNIPEGMSVAAPLRSGGSSRLGAVAIAALSGVPTILGAFVGYRVGAMGPGTLTVSLGFAAGAMLYVILGELLPESEELWRHKLSALATLLGLLLGLALIAGQHG